MSWWKKVLLFILAAAAFFVWYAVISETREGLAVYFLDVGQGDSTFIQAENGRQVLIDGGPTNAVLSRLGEIMPFYDRSIDTVILTHSDADHITGIVEVAKRYKIKLLVTSGIATTSTAYMELERIISKNKTKIVEAKRGDELSIGNGAVFKIIYPFERGGGNFKKTNNASIVARLDYGEASFLFTGDIESPVERKLVFLAKEDIDVDVLKVAHHGSKTSSIEEFLKAISPEAAVISAGKNNRYGHPAPEVVNRIESFKGSVYRTDVSGTVKIKIEEGRIHMYE